ncbi:MAG: TlpA family protein disulfide reductase [Deltaproteobacteria bacterium]|nr:TlpA family protein disulfide reductase [Deltaproteobacteria bacterium]
MPTTTHRRIVSLAALLALAAGLAAGAQAAVAVGAALPDAAFQDLSGNAVRTADLRGKPSIIAFWATWCTSCKAELDHLKAVRAAHGEAELRILAVSVDEERGDLDDFLASHSYPFPLYHDPDRAAAAKFSDDEDLPLTVVADAQGVVKYVSRDFAEGAAARLDAAVSAVLP